MIMCCLVSGRLPARLLKDKTLRVKGALGRVAGPEEEPGRRGDGPTDTARLREGPEHAPQLRGPVLHVEWNKDGCQVEPGPDVGPQDAHAPEHKDKTIPGVTAEREPVTVRLPGAPDGREKRARRHVWAVVVARPVS